MKKWIFSTILALTALLGCSPQNNSVLPPVNVSKHFPSMAKKTPYAKVAPDIAWWQQFHDKQLEKIIQYGLKNNPDIHIALANVEQARGALNEIKLSWVPFIEVLGGYSTNPALGVPGGFYGVWPYYALNIMTLISKQKSISYDLSYRQAMVDGARLVLIGQIASSYFSLLGEKEQLKLINTLLFDINQLVTITKKDIGIGLSNDITINQLQVMTALIQAQKEDIKQNIVSSQNAIRYLMNNNPGPINVGSQFSNIDFSRIQPGSLPATVLQNRPDFKMASYAVKRDYAGISIGFSYFFPTIQLDDFIGEAHIPNSTFEQATDAYIQGTFALKTFGIIQKKRGIYHESVAQYIKTVRQILKEVDTDISANNKANRQFLDFKKAKDIYLKKYRLQKGLYQTGLISYKELLSSKIELDQLALSENQSKMQLAMSMVALYEDLAGGYALEPSSKVDK